MELNELISALLDISTMRSASNFERKISEMAAQRLEAQQARITELEAELKEERYRHDRVQDFEVAEAQVLAGVKGQLDEAIRELQHLSACYTRSKNGTVCHVGMPVVGGVVCCGGYRWRGAKDTNVPGKLVTDTNVSGKEAT